jgi:hypothetical protein
MLYITVWKLEDFGRKRTHILSRSIPLGMVSRRHEMAKDKALPGKIRIGMSEKLNNVFGQYTSMEVSISLEFDGDVKNFESEIDEFTSRADAKIKEVMSDVVTSSGYDNPWEAE